MNASARHLRLEKTAAEHVRAGYDALRRHALEEARAAFTAALGREESAAAQEGLGATLCWVDDIGGSIAARQRAFKLYQDAGDRRGAARVATRLGVEFASNHAQFVVADGWFRRADRLLEGLEPGPEHAWLLLWEGSMALHYRGDSPRGKLLAARGAALSRELGLGDAQMLGIGLEGLRLVDEGQIDKGMPLLDEAATAALTGELPDLEAGGNACCYVLTTCERVRDYDRAMQWLDRVVAHHRDVVPVGRLLTYCRAHLVGVLTWRGEWPRAEEEIARSLREASTGTSAIAIDLWLRQAELRRLQGRFAEAADLLRKAEVHPASNVGWAALAFEEGDLARAIDFVHRHFRATAEDDRLVRAPGEVLLARAHAVRGEIEPAAAAMARLREVASKAASGALSADLRAGEGTLATAAGTHDEARRCFEDAVDLYARARNPFATARARLELAGSLAVLGRRGEARVEAQRAVESLRALGARAAQERGERLLASLASAGAGPPVETDAGPLSPRQLDVLRLLARGLSNREIGEKLFVSEFTVKRHVADILSKLDLPSRAAAAAYAAEHQLT